MNETSKPMTVTPKALATAYNELYPAENHVLDEDTLQIYNNWLTRYQQNPEHAVATQNWCGKVTKALFRALNIKQPRTKREMLLVLIAT